MKKHVLAALCMAGIVAGANAEETMDMGWKNSASAGLNLSQATFDNWSGGGEDAVAWQLDLNGKAEKFNAKGVLELKGKISYGKTRLGDEEFRKSTDELKLEATYTFSREMYVKPYVSGSFTSQMDDGFDYSDGLEVQISEMFDPAYITESAGVGIEPYTNLKLKLGAAAKQTLSSEDYGFADDPDTANEIETLRSEFGLEVVADYEHSFNDHVKLTSSLKLFSNLGPVDEVDSDWDTALVAQLTSAIQMSFNVRILRDADVSRMRQLKQNMAIGIVYTII